MDVFGALHPNCPTKGVVMGTRSLTVLLATFVSAGVLNAQEPVNFADNVGSGGYPVSLACAFDSGYSQGCGTLANACRTGCSPGLLDCGRFHVDGWLNGGFMLNDNEPASGFHGPYNQTDRHEGSLN